MKVIRQIIRGCGTLPHVGDHPGTEMVFFFLIAGGLAGVEKGGWVGFLGGMAFMALFILPLYLYGAYTRANDSDRMVRMEELKNEFGQGS